MTVVAGTGDEKARGAYAFEELRTEGVLWAINRHVFHPRGYALALGFDEDGKASGWTVIGDGSEPWSFAESASDAEDACFHSFEALLRRTW